MKRWRRQGKSVIFLPQALGPFSGAKIRRAFATIVDSNVTMFVAALILYLFGSGAVRGFAVSLGLGILTSVITAGWVPGSVEAW